MTMNGWERFVVILRKKREKTKSIIVFIKALEVKYSRALNCEMTIHFQVR